MAAHSDSYSVWCSNTMRTARSRISGEYLLDLFITPSSQEMEPPTNPGRFNELIFDAATRRERSEFVAFLYSDIPPELSDRAMITPNLQIISRREAIIGGIRANWKEPEGALPDVWSEGEFLLPDFKFLAKYLARGTQHRYEGDTTLRKLLREAIGEGHAQRREEVDV